MTTEETNMQQLEDAISYVAVVPRENETGTNNETINFPTTDMFTWVSRDPRTGDIVPYDEFSSRQLEIGFRSEQTETTLLIPTNDTGFVVIVTFDFDDGKHVQRSANDTGVSSGANFRFNVFLKPHCTVV